MGGSIKLVIRICAAHHPDLCALFEKLSSYADSNYSLTCIGCPVCDACTQDSSNWLESGTRNEPPCESCNEENCQFHCQFSEVDDKIILYTDVCSSRCPPFGWYYQDMTDEDNLFRHFAQCIESLHSSPVIGDKFEIHAVWFYHDNGESINAYATGHGFVHHNFENAEICFIGDEENDGCEEDDDQEMPINVESTVDDEDHDDIDDQKMPDNVDWPFDLLGSADLWDCSNHKQDWVNYARYVHEVRVILKILTKGVPLQPQHVKLILSYVM